MEGCAQKSPMLWDSSQSYSQILPESVRFLEALFYRLRPISEVGFKREYRRRCWLIRMVPPKVYISQNPLPVS